MPGRRLKPSRCPPPGAVLDSLAPGSPLSPPPPPRVSPASVATVCSSTRWKEEPSWSLSGHEPGHWASSSSSECCPPRTRQGSGAAVRAAWQTPALAARPQGRGVRLVSLRHFSEELLCAMCPSVTQWPQKGGGRENTRSPGASAKIGMLFSTVTSRPEGVSPFGLMCSSDPPTSAGSTHSSEGGKASPC